mmetsp:Transcript_7408/g.13320  ORF Transcript_7408/g.13320 Transcript_7408/m.13320 type:complete len:607 (-) Transcript_7408:38-1858(-)
MECPRWRRVWRGADRFALGIIMGLFVVWGCPSSVEGTVTVVQTARQYPSRPASFGATLQFGTEYLAHLQYLPDDVFLCGGTRDIDMDDHDEEEGPYGRDRMDDNDDDASPFLRVDAYDDEQYDSLDQDHRLEREVTARRPPTTNQLGFHSNTNVPLIPHGGIPVALLAKRGHCTFQTKARVAASYAKVHHVKFVIVYNDVGRHELITMKADGTRMKGLPVGLVSVSNESGESLLVKLLEQSRESREAGGIQVLLDGSSANSGEGLDRYPVLTFVLCFFAFIGLCMCCTMASQIQSAQSLFFTLGNELDENGEHDPSSIRLLTPEEVETLPEVEYRPPPLEPKATPQNLTLEQDENSHVTASLVDTLSTPLLLSSSEAVQEEKETMDDVYQRQQYDTATCCCICLDDYEMGTKLRVLPCHHGFHHDCILPWLTERSPTCPLCKAVFQVDSPSSSQGEDSDSNSDSDSSTTDRSAEERLPFMVQLFVRRRGGRRRRGDGRNGANTNIHFETGSVHVEVEPEDPGTGGDDAEAERPTAVSLFVRRQANRFNALFRPPMQEDDEDDSSSGGEQVELHGPTSERSSRNTDVNPSSREPLLNDEAERASVEV